MAALDRQGGESTDAVADRGTGWMRVRLETAGPWYRSAGRMMCLLIVLCVVVLAILCGHGGWRPLHNDYQGG